LIALVEACERLKAQAFGLQAAAVVEFQRMQKAADAAAGKPARDQGRGVTRQIGRACKANETFAATMLRNATILTSQMPGLYHAITTGLISERKAGIIIREARALHDAPYWLVDQPVPIQSMTMIDQRLTGDASALESTSNAGLTTLKRRVRAMVEELHPVDAEERFLVEKHASSYVDVRDIGHGMSELVARMETTQAATIYTTLESLTTAASLEAREHHPHEPHGLAMTTALFELVTGQLEDSPAVTIDLVISDETLLAGGDDPAIVLANNARKNVGTIPAHVARVMIANAIDAGSAWLQKLYANPNGTLIAASSKERFFPPGLGKVIRLRDHGTCREPGCNAAIKHMDHITPWKNTGPTTFTNGQGLCVRHNHNKEAHRWRSTPIIDSQTAAPHITTTDPFGNTTTCSPPPLPIPSHHHPCTPACHEHHTTVKNRTTTRLRPGQRQDPDVADMVELEHHLTTWPRTHPPMTSTMTAGVRSGRVPIPA
jgi:hypothetical protein